MNAARNVLRVVALGAVLAAPWQPAIAQKGPAGGIELIELLSARSLACDFTGVPRAPADDGPATPTVEPVAATSAETTPEPTTDGTPSAAAEPTQAAPAGSEQAGPADSMTDVADSAGHADAMHAQLTIEFHDVDVATATASGGDTAIDGEVRLMPTSLGLHFYQFSESGELSLVTVGALDAEDGRYPAVLSRHHAGRQALRTSQFAGTCTNTTPAE